MTENQFFERYHFDLVNDRLGEGGFAQVFKAYDSVRSRYIAIKMAEVKYEDRGISLMKEVEQSKLLPEHKHIAHYESCYRFNLRNGTWDYAILQYYPIGNLSQLIKNNPLGLGQKEQIAKGIIYGIQHIHSNNLIHRDIKSPNILISQAPSGEYVPKIADFGISKLHSFTSEASILNSIPGAGSVLYAAPEQLSADRKITKKVDLWSLGVVLFELFIGEVPFQAENKQNSTAAGRVEVMRKISTAEIPDKIEQIPTPWKDIIRSCLQPDPDKRPDSVGHILALVEGDELEDTVIGPVGVPKGKSPINVKKYFKPVLIVTAVAIITFLVTDYFSNRVYDGDPTEPSLVVSEESTDRNDEIREDIVLDDAEKSPTNSTAENVPLKPELNKSEGVQLVSAYLDKVVNSESVKAKESTILEGFDALKPFISNQTVIVYDDLQYPDLRTLLMKMVNEERVIALGDVYVEGGQFKYIEITENE